MRSQMVLPSAADLIGRGFTADVYAWGPGRVLKLFHQGPDRERTEREDRVTRAVHAAGLPVPKVHEVIQIDGRWGLVLERVEGPSMFDHVRARPWLLPWAVRLLAELHVRIHRCPAPPDLPTQRESIAARIGHARLTPGERATVLRRLAALPDGTAVCHGDFHPGNILLTRRGPVVIDWGRAARGHPLGDVAATARLIRTAPVPPWTAWPTHLLLRATRQILDRRYLAEYLRRAGGTRREVEAWQRPLAAATGPGSPG